MDAGDPTEQLQALLASLSRDELASADGRARMAATLRTTLDLVEGVERCAAACPLSRPGVRRAIDNLGALLADAQDHAEYLAALTAPRPRSPA